MPSTVLVDLEIGVELGSPTASDAETRPLEGGEEDATSRPRSASPTSISSTWRSFRWRVSCRGGARRSPASHPRRGWAREVEARAGEAGVEAEVAVTERWKADLERFHQDGITGLTTRRRRARNP